MFRALTPLVSRPLGASISALALACLCAAPAAANNHGTTYTLKVVEGETTLPEYVTVAGTSAGIEPDSNAQVAVAILHNGVTVYRSEGEGWAWLPQVPQPGETVVFESPVGHVIGSTAYDGMPTIDPSTCVGSANFEGDNTSGFTIEGSYITYTLLSAKRHDVGRSGFNQAQVKSLTGTSFGGSFLAPIPTGATVMATESLKTPLAGEATYVYESEREEPANKSCPAPPVSPAPAPLVTPLAGALATIGHTKIHMVLKQGYRDQVEINQAGTVTQDLYLRGGKLPAKAASAGKHHKTPPALLLARGSTTAKGAGKVSVVLKLTAAGRRKLKSSASVRAILLTTLRTNNSQTDTLAPKSLTFHH